MSVEIYLFSLYHDLTLSIMPDTKLLRSVLCSVRYKKLYRVARQMLVTCDKFCNR